MASWEELRSLLITRFAAPVPHALASILGGSQAPASEHHVKQLFRRVGTAHAQRGAPPGWVAPKADHTFGPKDQPATMA